MDLSAFRAADNAVKKIVKDYKPIADLAEALDAVREAVSSLGDLEAKKAALEVEILKLNNERASAEAEATKSRQAAARAKAVYDDVVAKLATFKV